MEEHISSQHSPTISSINDAHIIKTLANLPYFVDIYPHCQTAQGTADHCSRCDGHDADYLYNNCP